MIVRYIYNTNEIYLFICEGMFTLTLYIETQLYFFKVNIP